MPRNRDRTAMGQMRQVLPTTRSTWDVSEATPTYRLQRATGAEGSALHRSIMFSDVRHLAVHGDPGSLTTEVMTFGAAGPSIGRVVSTGHELELREADSITFLLPRAGDLTIRIAAHEYRVSSASPMAFRPTERSTTSVPGRAGRFIATTLQVPMHRMRAIAEAADSTADRVFAQDGVALTAETNLSVARDLPQLADDLFLRPSSPVPSKVTIAVRHLVEDQLGEMVERIAARASSRRIFAALHRVRQAEELMHAQSDDPLSILEIAQTLGVSLRSLQLAFNDVYDGLSPRAALNHIRLDKARQRLMAAKGEGQVTTVALECGFFHLSRFAGAYSRAFGERPSQTLARRRA